MQAAVALLFCVVCVSEVKAEDWVFYTRYGDSFFYDKSNINCPYEEFRNIVGVWQKVIYDDESIDRITAHLGVAYADLKESISLVEVDCSRQLSQTKAVTFYDVRGKIIDTRATPKDDWKEITPKSPLSALYKTVCPFEER